MSEFQNVWPVNSNNEIVVSAGTGDNTIVGGLPQDQIPVDNLGQLKLAGMIGLDSNKALVKNGIKHNQVINIAQNMNPVVRTAVGDSTDATFVTLGTITIPGDVMGPNGVLRVQVWTSATATASATKAVSMYYGGINVGAPSMGNTNVTVGWRGDTFNCGSETSQKTFNQGSTPWGSSNNPYITSTVDSRVPVTYEIKVKWSAATTAGDTITLLGYLVEAVYAP